MENESVDAWGIVTEHLDLALRAAKRMRKTTGHELEELYGEAVLALHHAARRFDPTREAQFATFAWIRMRGAMLDYLRRQSGRRRMPRAVFDERRPEFARNTEAEMREREEQRTPEERVAQQFARHHLRAAVDALPPREKVVVQLRLGGKTCKDIGSDREITRSWASRLEKKARQRVRRSMSRAGYEGADLGL